MILARMKKTNAMRERAQPMNAASNNQTFFE
jgi:hypothetical protein